MRRSGRLKGSVAILFVHDVPGKDAVGPAVAVDEKSPAGLLVFLARGGVHEIAQIVDRPSRRRVEVAEPWRAVGAAVVHPEGVVGQDQEVEFVVFREGEEGVEGGNDFGVELAEGLFEREAVPLRAADGGVDPEAQDGDAVVVEFVEVFARGLDAESLRAANEGAEARIAPTFVVSDGG